MKTPKIRFVFVFIGMLFFFNPYVVAVDFLPDFIGCLLIWLGLSRVTLINRSFAEARSAFLKLLVVDIFKNVMLVITMGAGNAEKPTALLLLSFSATVVELLFLIPAFKALFEGLSSLATLEEAPALYESRFAGLSRTDFLRRQTLIFIVLREILCLLPEFAALSLSSYDKGGVNFYQYIGALRALAFVAVLVLGIVWLVMLISYFVRLWRDRGFLSRLGEKYRAYADTHPGTVVERRYAVAFLLLFVAALFFADFYLDFSNVIPDFVAALLIPLALCFVDAIGLRQKLCLGGLSLLYGGVATYSSHLSYVFTVEKYGAALDRSEEAVAFYNKMWLWSLAEMLVFVALLVFVLYLLHRVVEARAGYLPREAKTEFDERSRKQFVEEFDASLLRVGVLGVVCALCSFLYDFLQKTPNNIWARLIEYFWMLDFSLAVVFAFVLGNLMLEIHKEIKQRFAFD